jgi:SAM-dependent methyltransferase
MDASMNLVASLADRYQIGPDYVSAYLDYWHGNPALSPCHTLSDMDNLRDHEKMWLDFALSANWRGRMLADRICAARGGATPSTMLDIGCGFGGILAAFRERGATVAGIEIDPVRVRLAQANLAAYSATNSVSNDNILDPIWVARAGQFEVITCIDVIEHVADVAQTLKNINSLLLPGGSAFLEIPNKDCLSAVLADGHFSLFGITQLPRWAAIRYHARHFEFEYDVGDYYDRSYYTRITDSLGLSHHFEISPLHEFLSPEKAKTVEKSIKSNVSRFRPKHFCDDQIDSLIRSSVRSFLEPTRPRAGIPRPITLSSTSRRSGSCS